METLSASAGELSACFNLRLEVLRQSVSSDLKIKLLFWKTNLSLISIFEIVDCHIKLVLDQKLLAHPYSSFLMPVVNGHVLN